VPVEIEVESLPQFSLALAAAPDIIMLDNFQLEEMREAVSLNRRSVRPVRVEASGGVDLVSLQRIAATGVDFVSVGALTKHLRAIDLSLRFVLS
jgi:nicotinate-nucleotide pyrophosphorylase (carboxylating)